MKLICHHREPEHRMFSCQFFHNGIAIDCWRWTFGVIWHEPYSG